MHRRVCLTVWTFLAVTVYTARVHADRTPSPVGPVAVQFPPEPRLVWNEAWPRFRPVGYVLMGASVAGALAATFLIPYPERPRWVGGILLDSSVRRALRARGTDMRDTVRTASDLTLFASVVQAGLIDGFIVPGAAGSWDVAWQLTLMNAQAFSLNILIATLLFKAVARARPTYVECEDGGDDPLCNRGSFASFPSSHTSTAFTAAGLTCIHHANLPLYGGRPWDAVACAGALGLAVATGFFRIVGDRHYLSDVFLGAAIGFSLGYVYPLLLHYQFGPLVDWSRPGASVRWGLTPGAQHAPLGLSAIGQF